MSFGITVTRAIKDAQVVFTAVLNSADEALSTAALLATGTATAPTAKPQAGAAEKNVTKAETSAKGSTEKQTQTASDSSASSSTESTKANEADAKGKTEDAPVLDYEKDIKPLVLGIAKVSRAKIEALLQRFGVATAKALTADQYPEFKELADKVIAGEYDPTASNDEAIA